MSDKQLEKELSKFTKIESEKLFERSKSFKVLYDVQVYYLQMLHKYEDFLKEHDVCLEEK